MTLSKDNNALGTQHTQCNIPIMPIDFIMVSVGNNVTINDNAAHRSSYL